MLQKSIFSGIFGTLCLTSLYKDKDDNKNFNSPPNKLVQFMILSSYTSSAYYLLQHLKKLK